MHPKCVAAEIENFLILSADSHRTGHVICGNRAEIGGNRAEIGKKQCGNQFYTSFPSFDTRSSLGGASGCIRQVSRDSMDVSRRFHIDWGPGAWATLSRNRLYSPLCTHFGVFSLLFLCFLVMAYGYDISICFLFILYGFCPLCDAYGPFHYCFLCSFLI